MPNATKTPQSLAGASHDFNDAHFLAVCQFAEQPHAATCLLGSNTFITSAAAGIALPVARTFTGARLALAGALCLCTAHLAHHKIPTSFYDEQRRPYLAPGTLCTEMEQDSEADHEPQERSGEEPSPPCSIQPCPN